MKGFFLKGFVAFLPISKYRGQLLLDSWRAVGTMTAHPPLIGIAANPASPLPRTGELDTGSNFAAASRTLYAGSLVAFVRRSGESSPSNPDAPRSHHSKGTCRQ